MCEGSQTVCAAAVSCTVVNSADAAFLFPSISISVELLNVNEYLSAFSKLNLK